MADEEWILDFFIQISSSLPFREKLNLFRDRYLPKFNNENLYSDQNMALHGMYRNELEPILYKYLSVGKIQYESFENIINDKCFAEKISRYKNTLFPILAIKSYDIFLKLMEELPCYVDNFINLDDFTGENEIFQLALRLSKEAYEKMEEDLNTKFEADIEKGIALSNNEYLICQKQLNIEKKMLEKAIELSIKEIELKLAEEKLARHFDKQITNDKYNFEFLCNEKAQIESSEDHDDDENDLKKLINTDKKKSLGQQLSKTSPKNFSLALESNGQHQPTHLPNNLFNIFCNKGLTLSELKERQNYLLDRYTKIVKKIEEPQQKNSKTFTSMSPKRNKAEQLSSPVIKSDEQLPQSLTNCQISGDNLHGSIDINRGDITGPLCKKLINNNGTTVMTSLNEKLRNQLL